MAAEPEAQLADILSTPLEQLLVSLGRGIGRSQTELDLHSIEIQRTINEDPVLSAVGLSATWYQIPSTELELKVSVAMQAAAADAVEIVGGVERPALPKLWIQPVNAAFQNQFAYD